ncbi:MAG: hypothetical protein AAGA54_23905 [Myxococcota bacterium]
MPDAPPFDIRGDAFRVTATWRGIWDESVALDYAAAARDQLTSGGPGARHLVVYANDLHHCDILARGVLTDLHHELRPRLRRTVFIASSARMRGLCLWIARVSDDENAKVFANDRGVELWLAGEAGRIDDARRRMSGSRDEGES